MLKFSKLTKPNIVLKIRSQTKKPVITYIVVYNGPYRIFIFGRQKFHIQEFNNVASCDSPYFSPRFSNSFLDIQKIMAHYNLFRGPYNILLQYSYNSKEKNPKNLYQFCDQITLIKKYTFQSKSLYHRGIHIKTRFVKKR